MAMPSIGASSSTTTTLVNYSTGTGSSDKSKAEAMTADPIHMKLISENIDDHPEVNIILLQIHKIKEDIDLIRAYFDTVETELDKKMELTTTTITAKQATQINSLANAFTGLTTVYGTSYGLSQEHKPPNAKTKTPHTLVTTIKLPGAKDKLGNPTTSILTATQNLT